MAFLQVVFLAALAGYASTATVDDCPAKVPRDHMFVFNGICYQFTVATRLDWPSANQECQSYGGSLALIKSKDVNDRLTQAMVDYNLRISAWIGLTDLDTEGDFYWEDRTKVDYSNWGPNQGILQDGPIHGNDDCVGLDRSGRWYDYPCQASLVSPSLKYYICQYQPIPSA